jgi:hypothetical protein
MGFLDAGVTRSRFMHIWMDWVILLRSVGTQDPKLFSLIKDEGIKGVTTKIYLEFLDSVWVFCFLSYSVAKHLVGMGVIGTVHLS